MDDRKPKQKVGLSAVCKTFGSDRLRQIAIWIAFLALLVVSTGGLAQSSKAAATHSLVELGRQLFHDARLSSDGSTSCASCHIPAKAFTDGRPLAIGVNKTEGSRNTPTLIGIGRSAGSLFFWDGRRTQLELTVIDPFINPSEMGLRDINELIERIRRISTYKKLFRRTFPSKQEAIALQQIEEALSAYIRSIDCRTSAFDLYYNGKNAQALNSSARRGLAIFEGKGQCVLCHSMQGNPPELTDHAFHRTGVGFHDIEIRLPGLTSEVIERSLQGSALGNRIASHPDEAQLGRFNVTHNASDIAMFRTPSLRGVSLTAPYMHDGSVKTLQEAIDREIYYRSLDSGHPLSLTTEDRRDLLEFLKAL